MNQYCSEMLYVNIKYEKIQTVLKEKLYKYLKRPYVRKSSSQVALVSGEEPACPCGRCKIYGFDPWVGKIPRRRAWQPGSPLQYPCLENSKNREAWQAAVHGATESDTTEATEPQPMLEERLKSKFYKVKEVRKKNQNKHKIIESNKIIKSRH